MAPGARSKVIPSTAVTGPNRFTSPTARAAGRGPDPVADAGVMAAPSPWNPTLDVFNARAATGIGSFAGVRPATAQDAPLRIIANDAPEPTR